MPTNSDTATHTLITMRRELISNPGLHSNPTDLCRQLTAHTQSWFVAQMQALIPEDMREALLVYALGSFGREELCPHSDLDVLIEVHDERILNEPEFAASIAALMDAARALRLRLKHAVRTPAQHREQLEQDWRTPIAMLDARPIEDPGAHLSHSTAISDALEHLRAQDHGESFIDRLIEAHLERRGRQNQSVYLLEPDIKSGLGALRDLHTLHWAAMVRFNAPAAELERPEWGLDQRARHVRARAWLLGLRLHIHCLNTRPQDRLRFTEQEAIASHIYATHSHPIEALMREHYKVTRACLRQLDRSLRQWGSAQWRATTMHRQSELPGLHDDDALSPSICIDLLVHASTNTLTLGPLLEQRMGEEMARWGADTRNDTADQQRFMDCLTSLDIDPLTSSRLLDLGVMTHMLPEFWPLVCHVQHDTYHVYTTDVHTLKCLERARSLLHEPSRDDACTRWPAFIQIGARITQPKILLIAALLHDIGKNRGGDHSNRGAALVPAIAARWALPPHEVTLLELLVRHHLLLSNTSRRRDITDPKVLDDLLEILKDEDTITLLTSLTFCDMSTVSPTSMNDWRANLLLQLHHGLLDRIAQHSTTHRAVPIEHTLQTRDALIESESRADHELFVNDVPVDHLQRVTLPTYQALFAAYQAHAREPARTSITVHEVLDLVTTPSPRHKVSHQVIVATRDIPGALAKIAGVLSAQGLNILSAEILSTRSGKVLDLFHVEMTRQTPHQDAPAPSFSSGRMQRLTSQLRDVLDEGADVRELLAKRRAQHISQPDMPEAAIEIKTYQDVSDDYTVVEVHAPDRRGLLYDIARVMHDQCVEVRLSKLDLLGNQAIDTFYVESMFSGKLSMEQTAALKEALDEVMRAPSPDWVHDEPE